MNDKDKRDEKNFKDNSCAKLELREEQLEISKEIVQTGCVDIHVETVIEEKTITVPVRRRELVIESRTFDNEGRGKDDSDLKVTRIPIIEEQIEIAKHPVMLEDVSVYKQKFQEIEHIEEIIKKEKLNIEASGDAKVILKDIHWYKFK